MGPNKFCLHNSLFHFESEFVSINLILPEQSDLEPINLTLPSSITLTLLFPVSVTMVFLFLFLAILFCFTRFMTHNYKEDSTVFLSWMYMILQGLGYLSLLPQKAYYSNRRFLQYTIFFFYLVFCSTYISKTNISTHQNLTSFW